jgi:hypothetical protein
MVELISFLLVVTLSLSGPAGQRALVGGEGEGGPCRLVGARGYVGRQPPHHHSLNA